MLLVKLLILGTLWVIVLQDLRSRSVYWLAFPVLIGLLLIFRYQSGYTLRSLTSPLIVNVAFLVLQFGLLTAYFSLKNKKLINVTAELLGWGDLLFLLSISVYLSALNFLVFYILSLVLILTGWLAWQFFSKNKSQTVPLAGLQALLLTGALAAGWWVTGFNLADDTWLLNLMMK